MKYFMAHHAREGYIPVVRLQDAKDLAKALRAALGFIEYMNEAVGFANGEEIREVLAKYPERGDVRET